MPDEPKTPDTRPGADITDGATARPYSQVGEKSAGQLKYEEEWRGHPDAGPWEKLDAKAQERWEWNATVTPKAQTIKAP